MQLKIQRSQRSGGMFGNKVIFGLGLRVEYSAQEKSDIAKYRLGDNGILYPALDMPDSQLSKIGIVTIDGLGKGFTVECQSIADLQRVESAVVDACKQLQIYVRVAESFDGREILVNFDEPSSATA